MHPGKSPMAGVGFCAASMENARMEESAAYRREISADDGKVVCS